MKLYLIQNKLTNHCYAGQTVESIKSRWYGHNYDALHGSEQLLHRAMREFSSANFTMTELCCCNTQAELDEAEIFLIRLLGLYNKPSLGYNMTPGGNGYAHCDATKIHLSEVTTDYWAKKTEEEKRAHMLAAFSVPWSEERKEAKRQSQLGTKASEETRQRQSEGQTEHWAERSKESVLAQAEKMRIFQLNTPTFKNKTHSESNRAIMSESSLAYWAKRRMRNGQFDTLPLRPTNAEV